LTVGWIDALAIRVAILQHFSPLLDNYNQLHLLFGFTRLNPGSYIVNLMAGNV